MNSRSTNRPALYLLISVFFFWGFVAASNTVLIPFAKKHFDLTQLQSQLVDFAFYIAYTAGALIYYLVSVFSNDPLNKIGYKKGLVLGLMISAIGAIGFVPAAEMQSFNLMLVSYFVIAFGFSLLQIVANPYVIALGDPSGGSHRVTLAGGINSFGTMIGPLVFNFAIFHSVTGTNENVPLDVIKVPYLILAGSFVAVALILGFSKLPPITVSEKTENDFGAFRYPQLILGMIAIFVYVGTEVTIQSNLPALLEDSRFLGAKPSETVHFISLYSGSLMIGRWAGAISVFNPSGKTWNILTVVIPVAAFLVILGVNFLKFRAAGESGKIFDLLYYAPCVAVIIAGFLIAREKPAFTMILFGSMATGMMLLGLMTTGKLAVYSFISGGLFCSVMWPCIFSLSIAGLGKYTNQGSSMLIMMIAGGAVFPLIQGFVADHVNIHLSYIVPAAGFIYLAFFGWKVRSVLKNQGIDYDANISSGH